MGSGFRRGESGSKTRLGRLLRVAWLALCVVPLGLYFRLGAPPEDAVEAFGQGILLPTLPAGLLAFHAVGSPVFAIHALNETWVPAPVQVIALWTGAVAAGYVQWFYLLPRLVRAVLRRREP